MILQVDNLNKKYKSSKAYTLRDVSFAIPEGEIFGLIGKNGAGKSTAIKSFSGIIPYTEGTVHICGHNLAKSPSKAKHNVGYVPDDHAVYDILTGREYATFMGNMYSIDAQEREDRLMKLATIFGIENALDKQISAYSHGMKQKICVIGALIHAPRLWVLDEPMLGLDSLSKKELVKLMREHTKNGNSVVFSSHDLSVVGRVCHRVGIIHNNTLAALIDVKKLPKGTTVRRVVNDVWSNTPLVPMDAVWTHSSIPVLPVEGQE